MIEVSCLLILKDSLMRLAFPSASLLICLIKYFATKIHKNEKEINIIQKGIEHLINCFNYFLIPKIEANLSFPSKRVSIIKMNSRRISILIILGLIGYLSSKCGKSSLIISIVLSLLSFSFFSRISSLKSK